MPWENVCFVSYANGQGPVVERFLEDFLEALKGELKPLNKNARIFLDEKRLEVGDFFNETIAHHLCCSATMILVFTPNYFDPTSTYCAREFRAFEKLEAQRLGKLGATVNQNRGLIFPIVFRGLNALPTHISSRRKYYDFANFTAASRKISKDRKYSDIVRTMAEQIDQRTGELEALSAELCADCAQFALPTDDEINPWLQSTIPPRWAPRLPARTAG